MYPTSSGIMVLNNTLPATVSIILVSKVPSDFLMLALSLIKAFLSTLPSFKEIITSFAFEKIAPSPLIG